MPTYSTPPTIDDLSDLAEAALAELPAELVRHVKGVVIQVIEVADDETLSQLGIESPWDLTGLYRGIPFGQRSTMDVPRMPDMIQIYREAVLLEWIETGEDLSRLVRSVLVHEIAHHFGFSDADIERLENQA